MALNMARSKHELSKGGYTLMEHQVDALKWMIKRETTISRTSKKPIKGPFGGILADDMGLGKTLEVISLILSKPISDTVIIVPANLINQWIGEFNKFAPHIKITKNIEEHTTDTVLVVSYIKAVRSSYIVEKNWTRIVLDEAHYIRNPKGSVHKKMIKIKSQFKWCLTGTPIQNYIKDVYSLLSFIGIEQSKITHSSTAATTNALKTTLEKYLLRRTKKGLNFDLPSISYETNSVEYKSEKEKTLYKKMSDDFMGIEIHILESLLRMRQAALLPQMVYDGYGKKMKKTFVWKHSNSKLDAIVDKLEEKTEDKPIIFCYFTKEIEYLSDKLSEKEISHKIIDGRVSMDQRSTIIEEATEYRVIIIQMMAGSTGLNLQAFNSVYFSGPHWNPTHEQQAIARVYRIGQTKPVTIRRFIMKDTIEELIVNIQKHKTKMVEEYIGE
jgi:SNF2 family DNA or RNA helicase